METSKGRRGDPAAFFVAVRPSACCHKSGESRGTRNAGRGPPISRRTPSVSSVHRQRGGGILHRLWKTSPSWGRNGIASSTCEPGAGSAPAADSFSRGRPRGAWGPAPPMRDQRPSPRTKKRPADGSTSLFRPSHRERGGGMSSPALKSSRPWQPGSASRTRGAGRGSGGAGEFSGTALGGVAPARPLTPPSSPARRPLRGGSAARPAGTSRG
jgi:hypothetical protein